ncbi:Dual specificity tyrosine-phosphorylation-regulated kinase, partial [Nowakowskiella sp. JEL0078]
MDRMSVGAVLPMAPAAENSVGNSIHIQNMPFDNQDQSVSKNNHYNTHQDSKMDSFTISVSNMVSNVSISVQTPSALNLSNHSVVTINPATPNDYSDHDVSTFGRNSSQTHSYHPSQTTPSQQLLYNNSQHKQPVTLFAELSAAVGPSDMPFVNQLAIGNSTMTNSSSETAPAVSVHVESTNGHNISIINNSAPQNIPHKQIYPENSQESQTRQIPQQNITPTSKRSSVIYSQQSQRRVSTATTNTLVGSPVNASSRAESNAKSRSPPTTTSSMTVVPSRTSFSGDTENINTAQKPRVVSSISSATTTRKSSNSTSVNPNMNSLSRKQQPNATPVSSQNTLTRKAPPTTQQTSESVNSLSRKTGSNNITTTKPSSSKAQRVSANSVGENLVQPKQTTIGRKEGPTNEATNRNSTTRPKTTNSRPNKLPLSPEACVSGYRDLLTPLEHIEIFDFPDVYYLGAPGVNKVGTPGRKPAEKDANGETFNNGYDDSRGDYYLITRDHVGYRYEIVSLLGKGSFGQVAKCFDHKDKRHVALKLIRNKKRFEKQGVVDVNLIDKVRQEDSENKYHAVHMLDHFYFRGHLCITFEMLGINLYEWLKAGSFRGVHLGVIRSYVFGGFLNVLLRDTSIAQPSYRDSNNHNFHRDFGKSSPTPNLYGPPGFDPNLPQYEIKVIDFGSSCFEHEKVYTYVQSRFYRSPEVILGMSYTVAIDMWSLGAILSELYTGYPLFPGENEQEQLACIMELKGVPDLDIIERGARKKLFFEPNGTPRI